MAIGTLVFDQSSYKNVLCLGHILAEDGRKMSKHLGNILEPIPLMDRHGADALRWFMLAGGSPWSARRVGDVTIQEVVRKTLLTYWNTVAFQALYARTGGWSPSAADPAPADRPVLDRWVLAELNRLVGEVDAALEAFDTQQAGKVLAAYVDDVSNWYVRRSRRRFWDADPAALATLHTVLETVTRLMAPLVPFVTERVWQDLVRPVTPDAPESVHLAAWPTAVDTGAADEAAADARLGEQVALVRRLVELGRATRAESGVKTRQPLGRALVGAAGWAALDAELRAHVAEELNVQSTGALSEAGGGAGGQELLEYHAKGNFRALGKRFGKRTPLVANAIAAADAASLAAELRERGAATVTVPGEGAAEGAGRDEQVEVTAEEVIVTETPREGWAVATADGETVALDLVITPELRLAGLARDAVRLIQDARKNSGLDVADRIRLVWYGSKPETREALRVHGESIAADVLAVEFTGGDGPLDPEARAFRDEELGLEFALAKA
jgi:isoleucyl-tRNA synthetase